MGGDAVGPARLGDLRRGPVRQRAAGADGRPARQGGGALGAHVRDGQPGRAADDRAAGEHRRPGGRRRTSSPRRRWGSSRSRASSRCSLWADDGRLDPAEVEELIVETGAADARAREHAHAGGRHVLTPELTAELARAAQRHGAYVHLDGARLFNAAVALGDPAGGARGAGEHGCGQPEQGPVRADGDDPRGPHAGDRARPAHAAAARRGERAQGGHRGRRGARRARHARRPARRRPPAGARARRAARRTSRASRSSRRRSRRTSCSSTSPARGLHPDEFLQPPRRARTSWPSSVTRAVSASSPTG